MRIVIYKGKFQYDVVNDFGTSIGEVLSKQGHEVLFLDLNSINIVNEILNTFKEPVDFVLSFNGIGYDLTYNGQSLYDFLKTPIVMWLVDHPIHILDRVTHPINHKIVICIDETHVDYLENNIQEEIVSSFIAHAARRESNLVVTSKVYDVVFAGHIANITQYDSQMDEVEKHIPNARNQVLTLLNQQGNVDLRLLINVFYHENPNLKYKVNQAGVMYVIDRYIRAVKREHIITQLLKQGVHIDFFGNISENHAFLGNPKFKHHGTVTFDKMKTIFNKSKMVLNVLPNFPNGGHERIFTSMMQGALPVTDHNEYIEKNLKHVLSFDYANMNQVGDTIQALLNNEDELNKRIFLNYKNAVEQHCWDNRVEELLYVVEVAKQYFYSLDK
ncbi:hypothetical protein MTP04_09630 [Lysinibacillus sp. PLM2]|nr:hypothetical protein MTP04_09630 [Lysinibacillus sp. PLM2]